MDFSVSAAADGKDTLRLRTTPKELRRLANALEDSIRNDVEETAYDEELGEEVRLIVSF